MWICHAVRIVTDYLFYFAKVARKKVCLAHNVLMRESCVIRSFHNCAVPMRTFLHFIAYLLIVLLLSNQVAWCHCSCCLGFFLCCYDSYKEGEFLRGVIKVVQEKSVQFESCFCVLSVCLHLWIVAFICLLC